MCLRLTICDSVVAVSVCQFLCQLGLDKLVTEKLRPGKEEYRSGLHPAASMVQHPVAKIIIGTFADISPRAGAVRARILGNISR